MGTATGKLSYREVRATQSGEEREAKGEQSSKSIPMNLTSQLLYSTSATSVHLQHPSVCLVRKHRDRSKPWSCRQLGDDAVRSRKNLRGDDLAGSAPADATGSAQEAKLDAGRWEGGEMGVRGVRKDEGVREEGGEEEMATEEREGRGEGGGESWVGKEGGDQSKRARKSKCYLTRMEMLCFSSFSSTSCCASHISTTSSMNTRSSALSHFFSIAILSSLE
eukprot:752482-Hanusia_phi.AAC.3